METALEHRDGELQTEVSKSRNLHSKLKVAKQIIVDTQNNEQYDHVMEEATGNTVSTVKKTVVKYFRNCKFVHNEITLRKFQDKIMDMIGDPNITRDPDESEQDKAIGEANRKVYRRTYGLTMLRALNSHRSSVQVTSYYC